MLEITNLNKTYYPKDGKEVKALDNLSLKIQDKGLVFILGKSGSGKSTLLNLLGGLDTYDSGDIIIKGKSTKDFKQKDFDSYRNTLIGFVFQEYNLLDEFSVGANIALAIELQGRKATNEEVNRILSQVDLDGYGSRKTNELSGGQKQRIAIARALVKNPEIIFADEPTGALDSNTGLQIFEFLRNLSKDKLVIVVSHDREFAESFGDRVIELSDGQVISDIIKVSDNNNFDHSKNLNYNEQDGFIVKENYQLTNQDLKQINDYLLKHKSLKISAKKDLSETQKVFVKTDNSKLNITSNNETFELVNSKLPLAMAFKMGASALNHKKVRLVITILLSMVAFTLFGIADTLASYNKVNAFTNSIIDNNINGLVYNKEKMTIRGSGNETYETFEGVNSNYSDLEFLKSQTNVNFKPVYGPRYYQNELPYTFIENLISNTFEQRSYYLKRISGLSELNLNEINNLGFKLHGNLPKNNDEIVITTYTYEHFEYFGYRNQKLGIQIPADEINNYDDIFNLEITLDQKINDNPLTFKIVGVLDTNFDGSEYEELKNDQNYNYLLHSNFESLQSYSYHSIGFVNEGMVDLLANGHDDEVNMTFASFQMNIGNKYKRASSVKNINMTKDYLFFDQNKTKLEEKEIIISIADLLAENYESETMFINNVNYSNSIYQGLENLGSLTKDAVRDYVVSDYQNIVDKGIFEIFNESDVLVENIENITNHFIATPPNYGGNFYTKTYNEFENKIFDELNINIINEPFDSILSYNDAYHNIKDEVLLKYAYQNYKKAFNNGFLKENPFGNNISERFIFESYYQYLTSNSEVNPYIFTEDNVNEILVGYFKDFVDSNPQLLKEFESQTRYENYGNYQNNPQFFDFKLKVVGISFDNLNLTYQMNQVILADETIDWFKEIQDISPFGYFITKMPTNKNQIKSLVEFNYKNFDDYFYRIQNEITPTLIMANDLVENTAQIFLYIGIGFAVFAGLMLSNFIASSVNFKKREIGILRALGARSQDVFEIFLQESLIIAVINFLFALLGTIIAVFFINRSLRVGVGLKLTIFNFGFRQVILLLLISLFVAIVASFFPVYRIAKKKPIDAITNK